MTSKTRQVKIKRLKNSGYSIIAHVWEIPEEELERRRAGRSGKFIPKHILDSMHKNFEFPRMEEGFECIVVHKE